MKLRPTAQMNWSKLENIRRIVANLVRYEFIESGSANKAFAKLVKIAKRDDLTLTELRALSASLSRNSNTRKRAALAKKLLSQIKRAA